METHREVRRKRGQKAHRHGHDAETYAAECLRRDGWSVLAHRLKTSAGELDLVAERDGVIAFIEVKSRTTLLEAAYALRPRQRARLLAAGEIALSEHLNGVLQEYVST